MIADPALFQRLVLVSEVIRIAKSRSVNADRAARRPPVRLGCEVPHGIFDKRARIWIAEIHHEELSVLCLADEVLPVHDLEARDVFHGDHAAGRRV